MKDELKLMKFVDPKTKSDFKALAKTNPLSPWRNFDNKKRLAMFTTNLFYKGACTPQETSPLESAAGISTLFPSVFRLRIPSLRWPAPSEKKTLSTYQGCRTLRQHWVASKRGWENRGSRGCWLLKKQTWIGNCSGREHPDVCNMNSIYIYIYRHIYIYTLIPCLVFLEWQTPESFPSNVVVNSSWVSSAWRSTCRFSTYLNDLK